MNRQGRRNAARSSKTNKKLKWVCNDHAVPSVDNLIPKHKGENLRYALEDHMKWRSQFIEGLPMKSKMLSVDELLEAEIVGLYTEDLTQFLD